MALVGIFVTGLLSAWRGLGSVENAYGNPYGNPYAATLLIKVALVMCAAALGGLNRFVVMPTLLAGLRSETGAGGDARKFARILHIEAIILVAAIVAAAFLSSTSPLTAA